MFVAFDRRVRVHLGVVTLGAPGRLQSCLEALVAHRSEHDFVVSLLVNPVTVSGQPSPEGVPEGVHVEPAESNLGWAGGLHRLRGLSDAELFAWVQDDSPTAGLTQSVVLSPSGARQIRIPVGVWHLIANTGAAETYFVNMPTEPYHHEKPDRILLPWDTDQLPVQVRDYLPKF